MTALPHTLQTEEDHPTPVTAHAYTHMPRHMVDAMLALISPDAQPPQATNPFIGRILASVSAQIALTNEVLKTAPDLHVLKQTLDKCPDDSLLPITECVFALLDHGHSKLAGDLLTDAPSPGPSSHETLLGYLSALLRLGRLSSGLSTFRQRQVSLAELPSGLTVLVSFQLGLWHLRDAARTFSDPRFPQDAAPGLLIAHQLLRCITGHTVPCADLEALRQQSGLHEYARLKLGVLCREAGDHAQALELLSPDSSHLFAQINRAVTLAQLGENSAAKQALASCNLPPCILNGHAPAPAQMREISDRLTLSYGQAATTPYFHFLTQLTVARLSFPLLPLRELVLRWHAEYAAVWRRHPEGSLIPTQLILPGPTS